MNDAAPATPGALPVTDVARTRVVEPVYGPLQIAGATFLATPIAGALLAAANLERAGRPRIARVVVVVAALIVAGVIGLDAWGYGPLTLEVTPVWALAALGLATAAFGKEARAAGKRSSGGAVIVVVAVWAAFAVAGGVAVVVLQLRAPSPAEISDDAVVAGPDEIVAYENGAVRADAERVSHALQASGYFRGESHLHVVVDKPSATLLRLTLLAEPPVTPSDVDVTRKMTHYVAVQLNACVIGRLQSPGGKELATGTSCP